MITFTPGSPDDVAWCRFAAVNLHELSAHYSATEADAMMEERAKRLIPNPAKQRPSIKEIMARISAMKPETPPPTKDDGACAGPVTD